MLNKEAIREVADIQIVAEEIGIPIRFNGKRPQILCPCHNDQHFGSCYLYENNTFKCYSCGAYGDVFKLVQAASGSTFPEAVKTVAEICGGASQFEIDSKDSRYHEFDRMMLSKRDQDMLGIKNDPVYVDIDFCFDKNDYNDESGIRFVDEYDADDNFIGYRVQKRIVSNPLYDLLQNNPEAYRELIDDTCRKKIQQLNNVILLLRGNLTPQKLLDSDSPLSIEAARCVSEQISNYRKAALRLLDLVSFEEITKIISDDIKRVQNISLKYGNGTAISKKVMPDVARITAIANRIWAQDKAAPF